MADTPSVDIDMTPMIDIVFQLITFFMVVINFDASDTDERVKMAISDLARPPKVKPDTELTLQLGYNRRTVDGVPNTIVGGPFLFYGGDNIPVPQFETKFGGELRRELLFDKAKNNLDAQGHSKRTVLIRADAECPTGVVQSLIRLCQTTGYEKFALKVAQPENQ
ncbi:MAG: ExbD/TolR family protein [Planctomycetales bacterium]